MPEANTNAAVQANPNDPVGEAQKEIEDSQKSLADAYKSLNQMNSLSINNGVGGSTGAADISALNGSLEHILAQPALRKYVKLMSSPDFANDLGAILSHPGRTQCMEAELGWFFFILVFRTWRYSKSKHWTKNLWIYLWTTLLFWVGAFYFIPHHFLDGAYDKLSGEIVAVIKQ